MFEMPLFPLNTVLFPGMPLDLHIFEDRYKLMMHKCITQSLAFGVVLIQRGTEALGPLAEPYLIGCTARIIQVQRLEEGRMNIHAVGQERFQIISLNYDNAYLVGAVELYPFDTGDSASGELATASRELRPWLQIYLKILAEIGNVELGDEPLPNDPIALAYLAAMLLQVPPMEKQTLLASDNALTLLTTMQAMYRREVALLRTMLEQGNTPRPASFSAN